MGESVEPETHVTLFTGNFGSGKSEVAVNLARSLAERGLQVTLGDLDVVKPYFRCREAAAGLEALGVRVIAPKEGWFYSDLPIVLPEVKGAMLSEGGYFLGDVGGDDMGARVIGSFSEVLARLPHRLLFVLNANRPFTRTREGALKMLGEIEATSRLRVDGLVSNTHLMEETDADAIRRGAELALEVATASGAPLKFMTAPRHLAEEARAMGFGVPVLEMDRNLLPPWKRRQRLGSANFRLSPSELRNL